MACYLSDISHILMQYKLLCIRMYTHNILNISIQKIDFLRFLEETQFCLKICKNGPSVLHFGVDYCRTNAKMLYELTDPDLDP